MAVHPLRIGVLASHGGSNMQAIIDRIAAGKLDARIVLVISNNSQSGAFEKAKRAGLPTVHISDVTHPDEASRDKAIRDQLVAVGAELIVLAGYMKKIGPLTLERYANRILNIHPALLPKHGGRGLYGIKPHESVLAAGDTESGATVHLVDPQYDHGPIVRQRRVRVMKDDTPETLQQRVLKVEHGIYSEVIADIANGKIPLPIKVA